MADYIYVTNPSKLKSFLEKIQEVGVPSKLTIKYLEGLGFKGKNERMFVTTMKRLGFVSPAGEPIERWKLYRNKSNAPAVLAQAIKEHYAELYKVYPDAHLKDNEALRNFFSTHTSLGVASLNYMISTFKTISSLADFEAVVPPAIPQTTATPSLGVDTAQVGHSGLVVNINIQLTLPEGATSETFEDFFRSMRKNLLD